MYALDDLDAQDIARRLGDTDDERQRHLLMRLVCGMAAINDDIIRQEVAYSVCRALFTLGQEIDPLVIAAIAQAHDDDAL